VHLAHSVVIFSKQSASPVVCTAADESSLSSLLMGSFLEVDNHGTSKYYLTFLHGD
jgi:hypothetical protein